MIKLFPGGPGTVSPVEPTTFVVFLRGTDLLLAHFHATTARMKNVRHDGALNSSSGFSFFPLPSLPLTVCEHIRKFAGATAAGWLVGSGCSLLSEI